MLSPDMSTCMPVLSTPVLPGLVVQLVSAQELYLATLVSIVYEDSELVHIPSPFQADAGYLVCRNPFQSGEAFEAIRSELTAWRARTGRPNGTVTRCVSFC